MKAFHIDMNIAQYKYDYLITWLTVLAELGYDSIIWEIEDNVQWETCPEVCSSQAFSKEEFKNLLLHAKSLHLESIPLLQTLGHCEYVLKHFHYKYLTELEGNIEQYCPLHPDLLPFLLSWIDEVIDLFECPQYFHLGADEAWHLGSCSKCHAYCQRFSASRLFVVHTNKLAQPLLEKGIKPIIWADMILHHHEALQILDKRILVVDWSYDIAYCRDKIMIWGKGMTSSDEIPAEALDRFHPYIFPLGASRPEIFYTTNFLYAQGLDVVNAPSSSSYGDNIFAPRTEYHLNNCFDTLKKSMTPESKGYILTSWSFHLFPWELQLPCIALIAYFKTTSTPSINDYKKWFENKYFNRSDGKFWEAAECLSEPLLFATTPSLGHKKDTNGISVPEFERRLTVAIENSGANLTLEKITRSHQQAEHAKQLFENLIIDSPNQSQLLSIWVLACENMICRAKIVSLLLDGIPEKSNSLLTINDKLQTNTALMYTPMIKSKRRQEMIDLIFKNITVVLQKVMLAQV